MRKIALVLVLFLTGCVSNTNIESPVAKVQYTPIQNNDYIIKMTHITDIQRIKRSCYQYDDKGYKFSQLWCSFNKSNVICKCRKK